MKAHLQKRHGRQSGPNHAPDAAFLDALAAEAASRAHRFIAGVRAYQRHPAFRLLREAPVIWQAGTTRLLDYNPLVPSAPVILVVPSLINRFDLLDLDHGASFLRTLAAHGFRPLLLDWAAPGEQEKHFTVSDYVAKRLIPAMHVAAMDGTPLHLLGYCMGGLLALAVAALQRTRVRTLTLLATPWDFHQPDPQLGAQFVALADSLEPSFQSHGEMSIDAVQGLFASMQPLQVVTKFSEFSQLDPKSPEARRFVLLEDWLNDGVPLTAPVARECLRDWYGANVTAERRWTVCGQVIDPRTLTMPSYVVAPGKDRIVPPECAMPLAKLLRRSALHEPMTGHVGLMASQQAPQQVWAPMLRFLSQHP